MPINPVGAAGAGAAGTSAAAALAAESDAAAADCPPSLAQAQSSRQYAAVIAAMVTAIAAKVSTPR